LIDRRYCTLIFRLIKGLPPANSNPAWCAVLFVSRTGHFRHLEQLSGDAGSFLNSEGRPGRVSTSNSVLALLIFRKTRWRASFPSIPAQSQTLAERTHSSNPSISMNAFAIRISLDAASGVFLWIQSNWMGPLRKYRSRFSLWSERRRADMSPSLACSCAANVSGFRATDPQSVWVVPLGGLLCSVTTCILIIRTNKKEPGARKTRTYLR
jgi:hypothetical protein